MLPAQVGKDEFRQRSIRNAACHAREDSVRAALSPNDRKSSKMLARRGLHRTALKRSGVAPFVLYSLRHTFLTRLGESGCDAWTLARIAGHSSVAISGRYVHPSEQAVLGAFDRLHGQTAHIEGKDDVVPAVVSTYADML
ncbi:MAG: hypothetical protein DMG74_10490 [Acidobacteria bacterium]|nr:MAG: hypothetical protein DMG74_10490 [Acidobacteriota bacterium]